MSKNLTIEELELKHQQQIELIEKKNYDTVLSLIRNYERQLKERKVFFEGRLGEADALTQESVQKLEQQLKGSLTWKIGWAFTSTAVLFLNFFRNPVQFCTNPKYRWKDLYYFDELNIRSEKQTDPVVTEAVVTGSTPPSELIAEVDPAKPTLMCVFDTFTKTCFAPEFNAVCPTPENWKQGFEKFNVDALFIESAWHGNDNSWETLTVNFGGLNKLDTMRRFVETARQQGIPSIFWNKEDPVHFKGFIDTARMMDYVFTSDADCITKYQEHISHKNIYALPFAAQHKVHNPVRSQPRNKNVSFAGTYYNFNFAERKLDLDILLQPSVPFGLDIYDRNFGATGLAAEEYKFPAMYQPSIRGKLEYSEMLKAYKAYKVFLNVNSVKYSSTMFARRVFELLACGTPVISNYSKGIVNLLGEDTVFISESESDTRKYLEKLFGDEHYWWQTSLKGMRNVMEHHTYEHRTREIFSLAGLTPRKTDLVSIAGMAMVQSADDAAYLLKLMLDQVCKPVGLVLVAGASFTGDQEDVDRIISEHAGINATFCQQADDASIRLALEKFSCTHWAVFHPDQFYGKNYLRDYMLAIHYSGAIILGKADQLSWKDNRPLIPSLNADYRWISRVPVHTLVGRKRIFDGVDTCTLWQNRDFGLEKFSALSIDPFNFVPGGRAIYRQDAETLISAVGI
jgi:spore maturation protein CgeB